MKVSELARQTGISRTTLTALYYLKAEEEKQEAPTLFDLLGEG